MTTAQVSANLHATGSIVPGKAGNAIGASGTAALDWESGDAQGAAVAGQAVARIVPGSAGKALGAAAGGAAAGAAMGSVVPGIGTAVGAVAGGIIGLASHIHIGKIHLGGDNKLFDKLRAEAEAKAKVKRRSQPTRSLPIRPPAPPPPPVPPRTIADSIVHEFVNELLADKGCPTSDQYLVAAHRALTKAQSEGLAVLALVQQKVSLVESVGLQANGLTAQVNACRTPVTARVSPRPVTSKPPEKAKSKKRVWLEVAGGGVGVVGIGMLAHRFLR